MWRQLTEIIRRERPDLCCFVEIEQAVFHEENFCVIKDIVGESYPFFDIENKYLPASRLRSFPLTQGKSNAFMAKHQFPHSKLHFSSGTKRLIYKIQLAPELTLFFSHFSLNRKTRAQQLLEVHKLVNDTPGEVIFMGDFNILKGFSELSSLLKDGDLVLLNDNQPTFTFHIFKRVLDICLCTKDISEKCRLQIIPQPYSDHSALLLEVDM